MRNIICVLLGLVPASPVTAAELSAEAIETASFGETASQTDEKKIDPAMIRLQVHLDRSRFSPGMID